MKKYVLGPNAARKLKALLAKSGGVSRRPLMQSGVAYDLEYAAPFTVKWAASANGGEGAWIIWLPSDELLLVDGEAVDFFSDLEPAGGDYPDGWYVVDCLDAQNGGDLYLNVHIPKADGEDESGEEGGGESPGEDDAGPSASFGTEPDEADDGEVVFPVLVAKCAGRDVMAVVMSAVVIGGGSGEKMRCVTSLNEEVGDMAIIGGVGIEVTTEGRTVKISLNPDKETEDPDPNGGGDPCPEHPGGGGGGEGSGDDDDDNGGGGGGVDAEGPEGSGGGCSDCGGNSTIGGESAPGGGGGESGGTAGGIQPGAHGAESSGVQKPNGKEAPAAPSSGASADGSGADGKSGTGFFNGSTIPKKAMSDSASKSPLYGGSHSQLSNARTMNESPFKTSGNYRQISSGETKPLYGGTHSNLTESNKMNESPFKRK